MAEGSDRQGVGSGGVKPRKFRRRYNDNELRMIRAGYPEKAKASWERRKGRG